MPTAPPSPTWTNSSVLAFAEGQDPLEAARAASVSLLEKARRAGMVGPPVDVVALAKLLGLSLTAGNTVADATLSAAASASAPPRDPIPAGVPLQITYNPTRPRGRLRFSIAHEIAHALFPDAAESVRHRTPTGAVAAGDSDEWELELLCNVIAAELLLPDDAVAGLLDIDTDIDFIMEARRRWQVSTEALLRRLATASKRGLTMVASTRVADEPDAPLRIEYAIGPAAEHLQRGAVLHVPAGSAPSAVGQTTRSGLTMHERQWTLQAVGAPPYPGRALARVLILLEPGATTEHDSRIRWVSSDITDLESGTTPLLVAHVVSDAAHAWSRRGVAAALARRFPQTAAAYRSWCIASAQNLALGQVHLITQHVDGRPVTVASLVAQEGYGPGVTTRLNYAALAQCLHVVAAAAARESATVHLPRIGAGQAGGRWDLIENLIVSELCEKGVDVVVHTLPGGRRRTTA